MTVSPWRKRCSANNGCVEWFVSTRHVFVRDSTDAHGSSVHVFTRADFARFVRTVQAAS